MIGRVAYPLCKYQAASIINECADVAPFGKGREAVVGTSLRKAWQIDVKKLTIHDGWLQTHLPTVVKRVCEGLGLDANKLGVKAKLYKMLVYEVGGKFDKHRDTEKEPGVFGSLIIQLRTCGACRR